jgi:hypothetical protein
MTQEVGWCRSPCHRRRQSESSRAGDPRPPDLPERSRSASAIEMKRSTGHELSVRLIASANPLVGSPPMLCPAQSIGGQSVDADSISFGHPRRKTQVGLFPFNPLNDWTLEIPRAGGEGPSV